MQDELQQRSSQERIAALSALFTACAAGVVLAGCGGDSGSAAAPAPAPATPTALTCDDSMIAAFKPDANTTVNLVKSFKKGDALALSGTPASPAPPVATNDIAW